MTFSKAIPAALAVAALAAAIPASAARETGEARLAKILDGRVAGQPVDCLSTQQRRSLEVVDGTALVFKDGDTYYVNRPAGANFMHWSDIPVFKVWGSQVCSKDQVQLRDSSTLMPGATMILDKFVPYKRAG
jgi:hypothetical protein